MTIRLITFVTLFFAATFAWAQSHSMPTQPEKLAKQTAHELRTKIDQNREKYENDPESLYDLAQKVVLPHFDFRAMARLALGRYWRQATSEQRTQFTEAFKKLLVHTYADSVLEYSKNKIHWKPVHAEKDAKQVTVRSEVEMRSGPPVPIDYSLYLHDGKWMVYNVTVDGISLITNYRSSFASQIHNNGMDALIQRVKEKAGAEKQKHVKQAS
jgi:phospholipid transport system substrate-binding protein